MTRLPGTLPLSELRKHLVVPHNAPERIAEKGDFYIRDGWTRPSLDEGHRHGQQVCYLVDFVAGDDERSVRFVLEWSPLREKVIELVARYGSAIGPCRLISKPRGEDENMWVIVGLEDDGSIYDPMRGLDVLEAPAGSVTR